MTSIQKVIHVEIRDLQGVREKELIINDDSVSLSDILNRLSQQDWAQDLFVVNDGQNRMIPGFLMILGSTMVQYWQADKTLVNDGQYLKIVKVVPGG